MTYKLDIKPSSFLPFIFLAMILLFSLRGEAQNEVVGFEVLPDHSVDAAQGNEVVYYKIGDLYYLATEDYQSGARIINLPIFEAIFDQLAQRQSEIDSLANTFQREMEILVFASGKQLNTVTQTARNSTITKLATGRYQVTFLSPHPDGTNYEVLFGADEGSNRDSPHVTMISGTQTANGFQVQVALGDNGGSADTYSSDAFSFQVNYTKKILTDATN